jgi:trimeric autotransporter adhesin
MTPNKVRCGLITATMMALANVVAIGYAQSFTAPAAATSSQATPYYTSLNSVQAVAVDNQGNIFATLPAGPSGSDTYGELIEFPAGGASYTVLVSESYGMAYPKGVAVDNLGNVFVTDYTGHLYKVPVGGGTVTNILSACGSLDNGYLGTQEVATDGQGDVYTSGNNEPGIFEITPSGTCSIVVTSAMTSSQVPSHIAVDPTGNISYSLGAQLYTLPVGTSTPVLVAGGYQTAINGLGADRFGNIFINDAYFIDEIPFVNGALNGYQFAFMLPITSTNDIGIDYLGRIYTTNGGSITANTPGSIALGSAAVGTKSATQTFDVIFNQAVALTGIQFVSGTATSTEAVNTGGGSCATGTAYQIGNSCTVTFTDTPAGIGQRGAAMVLKTASGVVGTAYIAAVGSGAGLVVDPGQQATLGSGWTTPAAVAVDRAGDAVVADSAAGTVSFIPAGSTTAQVLASSLSKPGGVAIAANGTVYVADTGAGSIMSISSTGGVFSSPSTILSGLTSPGQLAVSSNGDLYIADTGGSKVLRIPNQGGALNTADQATIGMGFSKPSSIALDTAGDIFIADSSAGTISEVTSGGTQASVATGLTTPASIALDPAGDIYFAASGSTSVTKIPLVNGAYNSNQTTQLGTNLKSAAAVAADQVGNLYVADATGAAVIKISRSIGALGLGSVDEGNSSAAQNLSLTNDGTQTLTLGTPYYSASGNTTDFTLSASASNGCASGGSLATGASCGLSVVFTPLVQGAISENLVFSSNAVNASPIQATISGTGINLPKTSLTLTLVSPTGTISYGETVQVSAAVAVANGGSGTPTGTVQFLVNGVSYGSPVTIKSGVASQTITGLPAGTTTINAIYSGDSNFAGSSGTSLVIQIALAPTATALTSTISSATPVPPGTSVTLTATISGAVNGVEPTGTVSFLSGTTVLGTEPVSTSGTATLTSTALPQGTYAVTASYSGDSGFAASSSTAVTISILPPQFLVSSTPSSLTVSAPGSVTASFVVTPISGYNGGIVLSCSGLPANTSCSFVPGSVYFIDTANAAGQEVIPGPQTVSMTVTTDIAPASQIPGAGFVLPLGILLLCGTRSKRLRRRVSTSLSMCGMLLITGVLLWSMGGCGSGVPTTPHGTSLVTVTLTGSPNGVTTVPTSSAGEITQSFTFNLIVN